MRGKGRDQRYCYFALVFQFMERFPSPCGEKVGINVYMDIRNAYRTVAFPSPCGEKVGINVFFLPIQGRNNLQKFPSPCGEKVGINIVLPNGSRGLPGHCFRPLAGKR